MPNRDNFRAYIKYLKEEGGEKGQGLSGSTINKFITVARRAEDFLDLELNLRRFAYRPEKPADFEALTVEETEKIATFKMPYGKCSEFLNLRNQALYLLAGTNGGNRIGEALNLEWEDVRSAPRPHVIFRDTKSRKDRKVYLAPRLWSLIQQLPRPSLYVFTSYRGSYKPLDDHHVNKDLQARAERLGIKKYVHYHLLRHTYATEQCENPDISPMDTADIMGYKDPRTILERYKKSSLEHQAGVILSHPSHRKDKPDEQKIKQLIKALYRVIDPTINPMKITHTRTGKLKIEIDGFSKIEKTALKDLYKGGGLHE